MDMRKEAQAWEKRDVLEKVQAGDGGLRQCVEECVLLSILKPVCSLISQDLAVNEVRDINVLRCGVERVGGKINLKVPKQRGEQAATSLCRLWSFLEQPGLLINKHLS